MPSTSRKNLSEVEILLEHVPFPQVIRVVPDVLLSYKGQEISHHRQANGLVFHPFLGLPPYKLASSSWRL